VPPPDPQGPWCEQFWIYITLENFHVNITYSGWVVLEEEIFKWCHPIFVFLRLSPLWKDLALDLYNFEFPLPKDDLYQVLLKFNWPATSGEEDFFFQNKHIEIWFSLSCLLCPLPTPRDHGLYKLESTLYQKAFM
jgi:hypothetical protein